MRLRPFIIYLRQTLASNAKRLFSFRGNLNRSGFIMLFFLTILSVFLLFGLTVQLFYYTYSLFPNWQFNMVLSMGLWMGWFSLITGFWPLTILLLYSSTSTAFMWGYEVGYVFAVEAVVVDMLYILYMLQCVRRCQDLGKNWYYCLLPLYNPFVLLTRKGSLD